LNLLKLWMMNKTTPQNVQEANEALFSSKMNLPAAAEHCGMTQKEMKMTFREYLKYHPINYE
jgi:transcriptional regulator GlxA family with amidase domain